MNKNFITILVLITFTGYIYPQIYAPCGTNETETLSVERGGRYKTATGNIHALIVFAQFKDDNFSSPSWPLNQMPDWADDFIESSPCSTFSTNNLTQYFYEMSNGTLQLTGDIYPNLIITDNYQSNYSIHSSNQEILLKTDAQVNYQNYDNWDKISNYNHEATSDGDVDLVIIIYRSTNLVNWSGNANLWLSNSLISMDGKNIKSGFSNGSGIVISQGRHGFQYIVYVAAHEYGHHLLGGNHIDYIPRLA